MDTKTTISGSGKNLEGAEWSNLKDYYCPMCDYHISDMNWGYKCYKCGFGISKERFKELTEES